MIAATRAVGRRLGHLGGAAVALAVALAAGTAPVGAAEEAGPIEVSAAAVLSDEWGSGDSAAIEAVVTASSLFEGRIVVSLGGGMTTTSVERDIDVAGGSTERFLVTVPMPSFVPGELEVRVEVRDGDKVVDSADVKMRHNIDMDVTGVMPQLRATLPDLPAVVTLEPDVHRSRVVTVPADLPDLGPAALSQLDTIAASSSDLGVLTGPGRASLVAWVEMGGRLLVDDAGDLSALPTAWRPGDAGYALAGRGEVRLTDGKAAAGKWKEILIPAEIDFNDSGFGINEMFVDPRTSLARRAGVTPPGLSKVLISLGVYAVVIGPLLYLLLRAIRRLSLAWLVIPGVALLTAGLVVVSGGSWRRGGQPVANVAREGFSGGSYTWTETLLFSRTGGRTELAMPTGWSPNEASAFFGEDASQTARRVARVRDGKPLLTTDLEPGQVAVMRASGLSEQQTLVVTAEAAGRRQVKGTVTNPGRAAVEGVAVFAGGDVVLVGNLQPGESKPYELDDVVAGALSNPQPLADRVWSDPSFGIGGFNRDIVILSDGSAAGPTETNGRPRADFGVWGGFTGRVASGLYPTGMVRAAGWRFDQLSELDAGTEVRMTELVTAVAPIGIGSGKFEQVSARAIAVNSPWNEGAAIPRLVTLLKLPPEATTRRLQAVVQGVNSIEVWNGGKWEKIKESGSNKFPVPTAAAATGNVLIRTDANFNGPFGPSLAAIEEVR